MGARFFPFDHSEIHAYHELSPTLKGDDGVPHLARQVLLSLASKEAANLSRMTFTLFDLLRRFSNDRSVWRIGVFDRLS